VRPGFATGARRIGDACQHPGCTGHYRLLSPAQRDEYAQNHPYALRHNSHLTVAECDVCGMDVVGLEPKEGAST
jgi:hypothetical protein